MLTHAHEDHLGAVPYLWEELGCPVYATAFTAAVLKAKLADEGIPNRIPLTEVKPGTENPHRPVRVRDDPAHPFHPRDAGHRAAYR